MKIWTSRLGRLLLIVLPLTFAACRSTGVSNLAIRDDQENNVGRYVGGSERFGEPRRARQGTWARDYARPKGLYLWEP